MAGEPGSRPSEPDVADPAADTFVAHLLRSATGAKRTGSFGEAVVSTWSEAAGWLDDGRPAEATVSCLVRPAPGDRALIWSDDNDRCWVLAILQRADPKAVTLLTAPEHIVIEAPRIAMNAAAVHLCAEDFLSSVRSRHAVEDTRTEISRVRVSQVGTDIRRATTSDDTVTGTLMQRAGTWISNTARDARLRARTFLFD